MDFLNKLGDSIVNAGKEVTEKAKDYTDAGKLQYEISKKKSEINEKYRALGKKYYAEHMEEKDDSIVCITAAIDELHELERRLADTKGGIRCEKCGAIVPLGSSFCGKCGAKVGGMFEEEDEEDIFD
ncbi:MAG: zinc ribbon domain-containing protein [Lachnospiraceae bacterium]|nr:zinc ribbon domain-containing protein [Lachnospiraceae bacterium]